VLLAVEREAGAIRASGKINTPWLTNLIEFFKGFVDKCHHAKEEKEFIPRMLRRSQDDTGLIASILLEHMEGRRIVREISAALPAASKGDSKAITLIADELSAYVTMLRGHIQKENRFLFARANEILTDDDQLEMEKGFERIEREEIGEGKHERYHKLAEDLSQGS
jgi:hemerythrin-like domain-containing protein